MELERMTLTSASGSKLNLDALYQIMPSCFTEVRDDKTGKISHKINFTTLRELLGDNAYEGADEEYGFSWVGKNAARREAASSINKTLRPCPEESVDWDNTENLYIEGDNLEVLKLLQKSYLGKIKMIYIDPPYNTGNDFVYRDAFDRSSFEEDYAAGNVDEDNYRFRKNTDTNSRFHSNWCSMMYARLLTARSLLSKDGVIFISIDEVEVNNLQKICNEIFGATNFVSQLVWAAGRKNDSKHISVSHEFILCYVKNMEYLKEHKIIWREKKQGLSDIYSVYDKLKSQYLDDTKSIQSALKLWYKGLPDGHPAKDHKHYNRVDKKGIYFAADISWPGGGGPKYEVLHPVTHKPVRIPSRGWITNKETLATWIDDDKVDFGETEESVPTLKAYLKDMEYSVPYSVFYKDGRAASKRLAELLGDKVFENPKDEEIIARLIDFTTSDNDLILDFFSGSATTAHAIFLNSVLRGRKNRFILVQIQEEIDPKKQPAGKSKKVAENACTLLDSLGVVHNICELGKERIRRAGKKIKEEFGDKAATLDTGFRVFKCEDSFMNDVYFAPSELKQEDLFSQIENIKDGTSDLSLLFGCMLDWGVQLSLPLSHFTVAGKTIHNVNDGDLVACFAEDINEEVISAIAELSPLRVVFRDSCFSESAFKMNLFELFKQKCGWSEEQVRDKVRVI